MLFFVIHDRKLNLCSFGQLVGQNKTFKRRHLDLWEEIIFTLLAFYRQS